MILESYLEVAKELQDLYDEEIAVTISDPEKVIAAYPGPNLDLKVQVGDPIPKGTTTAEVFRTGKRVVKRVPSEVLGIPYVGIGHPIREDNQIVACIVVSISIAKYDALLTAGQEILAAVQEISASAESLSAASQELASTVKAMSHETAQVLKEVTHTNTVTEKIHKISMQSNILGLNASIEAARAGQHGQGFSVVADEIRKLAVSTKSSTHEIEADLKAVQSSVNTLVEAVKQLYTFTDSQAIASAELTNALSQIARMAEKLVLMGQHS